MGGKYSCVTLMSEKLLLKQSEKGYQRIGTPLFPTDNRMQFTLTSRQFIAFIMACRTRVCQTQSP